MIQVTNINTTTNSDTASVKLCLSRADYESIPLKNAVTGLLGLRINKDESRRDMSVVEFAKEAGISRQAVIKMIGTGRVQALKIGERYIISPEELTRYLTAR